MKSTTSLLRRPWAAAALLLCLPAGLLGASGAWTVYETAQGNGHRLAAVQLLAADAATAPAAAITCDTGQKFQLIEGFGGALTESSGWVLDQLPAAARAEVLRKYYDPKEGIGYTLARTHINSCDFSIGSWSLDPVAGDTGLAHFSLDPMRKWVLPLIHEVQSVAGASNFHLLASPWSPPSWMKTNGVMISGGSLSPEYRQAWADYLVRFVREMEGQEHIPVWALTVQNEPQAVQTWESCVYSAAEERDFIRDNLGPALAKADLGAVHLCILDHNRDLMDEWTTTIFSDAAAARYAWGTAIHWYVSEDYAAAARAHAAFPDKATIFTEGCNDRGEATGKFDLGMWEHGERYAHSMVNDFRNWVCGWIDWNIVLDQTGGPNHVGNFCDAPVIVDTEKGEVRYTPAFYYIGQFSRFVHPGARRIESHGGPAGLESVAFANPDGGVAVVVLNTAQAQVDFRLGVAGQDIACRIPARAIQTYVKAP
jgi:glucosylceramidase